MNNQEKATAALGVASYANQVFMLIDLDIRGERALAQEIRQGMLNKGSPTTIDELIAQILIFYREQNMSSWEQRKFMSMVGGSLASMGTSQAIINSFANQVSQTSKAELGEIGGGSSIFTSWIFWAIAIFAAVKVVMHLSK